MDYYTITSESYKELHRDEQLAKLRLIKSMLNDNFNLYKNKKILDIGCGPFWSREVFDGSYGSISLTGIDPADFGGLGDFKSCNSGNFKFIKGIAESLPFEDCSFDIILCVTAIHHFELEKAISEIKRVAKKDAVFVITVLRKSPRHEEICCKLKLNFSPILEIEEDKDTVFFLIYSSHST